MIMSNPVFWKVLEYNMNSHLRQLQDNSMIALGLQKLMEEALLEI